jgi:hypothetical protein
MARQSRPRRVCRYASLLVGRGWQIAAFLIATVYSVYTFAMPLKWQEAKLRSCRIDPTQRYAVLGFGLSVFFLYAGFRAWDDVVEQSGGLEAKTLATLNAFKTDGQFLLEQGRTISNLEWMRWERQYEDWFLRCRETM